MKKMNKHPLRITADALRNAFLLNGFELYDNGEFPQLEKADVNVKVFSNPEAVRKQILLENGEYALRAQILPYLLPALQKKETVFAAATGMVFDGSDEKYPAKLMIEGMIAADRTFYDLEVLWRKIVRTAFGAVYDTELVPLGKKKKAADMASWGSNAMAENTLRETASWQIAVKDQEGNSFILGSFGTPTWLGMALAGRTEKQPCYVFSLNIEKIAMWQHGITEKDRLYSNTDDSLSLYEDGSVSSSDAFEDKCRDVLRTMGYSEGFGMKIYPDGIYKKMNMIQDEWDLNNKGVQLKEPLGEGKGLPTVLTPAIEQILSEKWAAGEKSAKAFEVAHIFMPQKNGSPIEKLALSFGAYGDDMDLAKFRQETDKFLTAIGNKNHFFIPTGLAIAYNTRECLLLLDEKMSYLGGNLGGISEIAEKNFSIGTHAFMANLELMPLKNKADEEYGYIAPELR